MTDITLPFRIIEPTVFWEIAFRIAEPYPDVVFVKRSVMRLVWMRLTYAKDEGGPWRWVEARARGYDPAKYANFDDSLSGQTHWTPSSSRERTPEWLSDLIEYYHP